MKKILYTTTALVAATVISSAAMAQTESARYNQQNDLEQSAFKATVGGYANWYVGYADNNLKDTTLKSTTFNEFDILGDAEVHFNFEAALRNGMTVGAHMELITDTTTSDGNIDQTYMYVNSQYGKVMVGRHDNVSEQLSVHAIDVGALDIQDTDFTDIVSLPVALPGSNPLSTTYFNTLSTTYFNTDEELTKISYITPNFQGFQAGMTYAPTGTPNDNTFVRGSTDAMNATMFSAAYSNEMNGVGFALSAGYGFNNLTNNKESITQWNLGARAMYKGFSLSAAYKDMDQKGFDGKVWDLGVAYEMGPYGMSLSYISGDAKKIDKQSTMLLSGTYNMAAGVDAFTTIGWGDYKVNSANKNDGWAIIGGMMLSF